jgi:hypothetical protein
MKAHISVAEAMNFVSNFVPEQNRQEDRVMVALYNEVQRLREIINTNVKNVE